MRIILIVMLLLSCCLTSWAKAENHNQPTIYTENKLAIMVPSDQPKITIKLKSNPTTGYSWFLREYNSDLMSPVKHVFEPGDTKLVGAPGFETWTFHVKPAGFLVPQQTVIRFVYARPWEDSDQAKQVVFRVSTMSGEKKSE